MASVILSMPDAMKDWIESRIKDGEYASTSDYVRDLVRRDRERRDHPELTLDDLRRIVAEARAGGISDRSISDIKAEALQVARARDLVNE
ncbi:MAG TPA: type II toxin-antitoxin system ParD family antitoxin [Aurantimonas coralicida]|uniref:Type II toxin-antitoxin system ParD family antitoxin n=2 Tax=root TaxID=1 RepID=A0A9C9NK73_9HYPH|nr:type II toxin-antitoxin system ParD family antitoxin [Aurantimonas coralicida]HEU03101.1 type II toxin-antitoxin system ParD family antitoxin [Aurantimonas coralicida]